MKTLIFALVLLVTTSPRISNQNLLESKYRNQLGFPDEDIFNTNDTSCIIINGDSLPLESCLEHAVQPIPFTPRKYWDSGLEPHRLDFPVKFVVVKDGGRKCDSTEDCTSEIKSIRRKANKEGCELRENFYVGGDGNVYEGRGWDLAPYWNLNGLRNKSITVQFLGTYKDTRPSPEAIEAFETAMEIGLWQGKLSKFFKVTSFQQLHQNSTTSENAMDHNPFESSRWWNGQELSSLWEYTEPDRLKFVFRRKWNASDPTKHFGVISQPVHYVMISEGEDMCLDRDNCISRMKAMQEETIHHYGDLLDNFYIGESGEVYEGRGWQSAPHWYVKGFENDYISVRLFGSFVNELPSRKAMNSLKLLVKTGVRLGKISRNYQLFSLRQIYNQSVLLGSPLHEHVRTWSIWSEDLFKSSKFPTYGLNTLILRSMWGAVSPTFSFPSTNLPVKYIMISDGGNRCFSISECSSLMQREQSLALRNYGDLLDNFYIGDDGIVYEGRGWGVLPFLHAPFFNQSLITVKFLGSFESVLPSKPGWLAFLALLDAGIASGNISRDYKLYSFRHIYNDSSLLGDTISHIFEEMREWDGKLSLEPEDKLLSSGVLPIYYLNPPKPKKITPLSFPIKYVVLGSTGERCFIHTRCFADLQESQRVGSKLFGSLSYNFYVGEDGGLYAGRGWNSTSEWHVTGIKANTLYIAFSGRFLNVTPDDYAHLAIQRLMKSGEATGKFATDYKIISIRQIFPNSSHSSDFLHRKIVSNSSGRWSEYEALSPGGMSIPFGPSAFVQNTQWSARGVLQNGDNKMSYPIPHVIILDADTSCFNLEDCIARVQAEQRRVHPTYGNTMENFYIGEDGRIYEGKGWFHETHWHSRIWNFNFITVAFLGRFQTQIPSLGAFTAFEYWIKEGIMEKKLSANFTVTSMRQLIKKVEVPGEALHNHMRTMDNLLTDFSEIFTNENFTIVSPGEWASSKSIRRSNAIIHPLKYVYIREGNLPCSKQSDCVTRIKNEERTSEGITENFYIGGTGVVFEGVGWHYDTKWAYPGWKNSISVMFFGTFTSVLPSKQALAAFRFLCQYGTQKGYIDPNYKILYIPQTYNSRTWVGEKFINLIKTWEHWAATI